MACRFLVAILSVASLLPLATATCNSHAFFRTCGLFNSSSGEHTWWATPADSEFGCAADMTSGEVYGGDYATLGGNTSMVTIDIHGGLVGIATVARGFIRDGADCAPLLIGPQELHADGLAVYGSNTDMFQVTFAKCTGVVSQGPFEPPPMGVCLSEVAVRSRFVPRFRAPTAYWKSGTDHNHYKCSKCPDNAIVLGSDHLLASGNKKVHRVEFLPGQLGTIDSFCARQLGGVYFDGVVSPSGTAADAEYQNGDRSYSVEVCYRVCTDFLPGVNVTINLPPFVNNETFLCLNNTIQLPPGWLASQPPNTVYADLGPNCSMTLRCEDTPLALVATAPPRYDVLGPALPNCVARGFMPLEFVVPAGPVFGITWSDMELVLDTAVVVPTLAVSQTRLTGTGVASVRGDVLAISAQNLTLDGLMGVDGSVLGTAAFADSTVALTNAMITGSVGSLQLQGGSVVAAQLF
jgi:hypothetical protein